MPFRIQHGWSPRHCAQSVCRQESLVLGLQPLGDRSECHRHPQTGLRHERCAGRCDILASKSSRTSRRTRHCPARARVVTPACTLSTYQGGDAPFPELLWSSHFGRVRSVSRTQSGRRKTPRITRRPMGAQRPATSCLGFLDAGSLSMRDYTTEMGTERTIRAAILRAGESDSRDFGMGLRYFVRR
jgi:hypothetical protein